jgi:hypothetical protein
MPGFGDCVKGLIAPFPVHPREGGDPVLWVLQRS